jgi:hypothetical protein
LWNFLCLSVSLSLFLSLFLILGIDKHRKSCILGKYLTKWATL